MSKGSAMIIAGQITRLRVFNYLKRVMTDEQRCPDGVEVSKALGISGACARIHMLALDGATGLPMRVASGRKRTAFARENLSDAALVRHREGARSSSIRHGRYADLNYLPVDQIVALDLFAEKAEDL